MIIAAVRAEGAEPLRPLAVDVGSNNGDEPDTGRDICGIYRQDWCGMQLNAIDSTSNFKDHNCNIPFSNDQSFDEQSLPPLPKLPFEQIQQSTPPENSGDFERNAGDGFPGSSRDVGIFSASDLSPPAMMFAL